MSPRGGGPPTRPPPWKALLGLSLQKIPRPHSHTSLLVHTAAGDGGRGSHPQQLKGLPLLQAPAEVLSSAAQWRGNHTPASPAHHHPSPEL